MAIVGKENTFSFSTLTGSVLDISVSGVKCTAIDTSHQGLTERTFAAGLVDSGEVKLSVIFDTAGVDVGESSTLSLLWSDNKCWQASAILTGYDVSNKLDANSTADLTFKISGAWDFDAQIGSPSMRVGKPVDAQLEF